MILPDIGLFGIIVQSMWILFDILRYSFSSVIWGIIIAFVCMALFVFLIKGWYKGATFSPVSYVVGAILFLFLSFQCIMIVGSLKIIDTADYYETEIASIVNSAYDSANEVTMGQADGIIQEIIERFPILHYYICGGEFSGFTAKELPYAIVDELRSFMRWYIFHRLLWCLVFVIVGAICVIKSMSRNYNLLRQGERTQRQRVQTERRRVRRNLRR